MTDNNSKKRKSTSNNDGTPTSCKKSKVVNIDMNPLINEEWISASKTRNYMLKDPLLDWLTMYGEKKGYIPDKNSPLNFGKFIMNKGVEFEKYIVSLLKQKHSSDFHEVSGKFDTYLAKLHRQIKDTYNLMKSGAKIIYQGLVYNPSNKTWGYPDLIVRSDYLNNICESQVISEEKSKKGCNLSDSWHYRIVDIKYTTLKLKVDEKSLLNSGSTLPYKAQTYIYNQALGYMQNLIPRKAYLLGRGWNSSKKSEYKPFDKLGQVDFVGNDSEIAEDVVSSLQWIRDLRSNGNNWTVSPPSVPELYPNMCNDSNNDWGNAKKKIAEDISEITMVWQCGVDDRDMCHGKNVLKWTDKKCTSELMGKGGKVNPPFINKILEVNRGEEKYYLDKSVKDTINWKKNNDVPSFFIDFETVSNINNIRSSDEEGNIFMIGSINDLSLDNNSFSCFVSSRLTSKDEKKTIEDFLGYISSQCGDKKYCRFYHYSFAEPSSFKKALQKYNITTDLKIEWIDLLSVVKSKKFIVKGALDFSLKSIVNALSINEMIDMSYVGSEIGNGSEAMISAFVCDDIAMKKSIPMYETDLMKDVIKYNKIDCEVLKKVRDLLEKLSE